MPGFCANIVLAFISGLELFDCVINDDVDGGGGGGGEKEESVKTWLRRKEPNGGYGVKMGRNETLRRP